MLNPFFFPFLRPRSQPEPQPETPGVPDADQGAETNEQHETLASPAPLDQPEAPQRRTKTSGTSRARKPAGQAGADKAVASRRRTKRPKGAEARSKGEFGAVQPVAEASQGPVIAEAAQPAPNADGNPGPGDGARPRTAARPQLRRFRLASAGNAAYPARPGERCTWRA